MDAIAQQFENEGIAKGESRGIAKGREIGVAEGLAKAFLMQARSKFRRVPKNRQAQVRAASIPQLEEWMRRILTATSLNAVLDGDDGNGHAASQRPRSREQKHEEAREAMDPRKRLERLMLDREALSHIQGVGTGITLGERMIFERAAKRRFQSIPDRLMLQMDEASSDQFDAWFDRLYEVSDLESVFSGSGDGKASE